MFTNHNIETVYKPCNQIRYIAYALETCPKTQKKHHQGFIYTHNNQTHGKRNLQKLSKIIEASHVEPMRGKISENEYYCSKEGELIEIGEKPTT